MSLDRFEYSNGYDYDEYSVMCNFFKNIKLPFLKGYDVNRLLADYIFGYSMGRFPVGKKNILRRYLGSLFLYPLKKKDEGKTAFVFTGDGVGRPDYLKCIEKVKEQCNDSALYIMDRVAPRFIVGHIFSIFPILIWAIRLNEVNHKFDISFDMAVALYRTKKQGKSIYREIGSAKKLVTFCDLWSTESFITQTAKRNGLPTATLQHGNGTDILYGSCSDYYLANSKLSKANCVYAGIPEDKVIVVGPMKYANEKFEYKNIVKIHNIGIVLDGAKNYDNNVEMIRTVHDALDGFNAVCCIRFHPNNKREEYTPYFNEKDIIYDDLIAFEKSIDICIVYNSSMFTDMIYKKILVYRYKNGKIDLFPRLSDKGFSSSTELRELLADITSNIKRYTDEQEKLYAQVFGTECKTDSYREFFDIRFK